MSASSILSRTVELVHIFAFRLNIDIWFEYIGSSDSWADGLSRNGYRDAIAERCLVRAPIVIDDGWWYRDLANAWRTNLVEIYGS